LHRGQRRSWCSATRPQRVVTAQGLLRKVYPTQRALTITLQDDVARRAQWQELWTNRFRTPMLLRTLESKSMESGPPPESYLAAKRIAIEYVRRMRADLGIGSDDQLSFSPEAPRAKAMGRTAIWAGPLSKFHL